jgi:hypothetical protein
MIIMVRRGVSFVLPDEKHIEVSGLVPQSYDIVPGMRGAALVHKYPLDCQSS